MSQYVLGIGPEAEARYRDLAMLCDQPLDAAFLVRLAEVGAELLSRAGLGLTTLTSRGDGKVVETKSPWLDRMAGRIRRKGADATPILSEILDRKGR